MPADNPEGNVIDESAEPTKKQKIHEIEDEIEQLKNALHMLQAKIEEIERKIKEEKIISQLPG